MISFVPATPRPFKRKMLELVCFTQQYAVDNLEFFTVMHCHTQFVSVTHHCTTAGLARWREPRFHLNNRYP